MSSTSAETTANGQGPGGTSTEPAEIQADIERTREDLAQTVDALQAKLDVKTRTKAKLANLKDHGTTAEGKPRPDLLAGAAVAVLLVAGLVWWRSRR